MSWTYVQNTLMENKLMKRFMKKNCKRQIKHNLGSKKEQRKNADKLYVNWKGYDNRFNSWIDKKRQYK